MQSEIEAKFLAVDHNALRSKLKALDAALVLDGMHGVQINDIPIITFGEPGPVWLQKRQRT